MNGKGDTPRPLSVDTQTYHDNWDRIFGNNQSTCEYSGLANTATYEYKKVSTPDPEYVKELQSGMFCEWYPDLSGTWETDKLRWTLIKLSPKIEE
jgi:hypothetical protein